MNKRKLVVYVVVLMLILTGLVNANNDSKEIEWTDFSNVEINLSKDVLSFDKVTFNTDSGTCYYAFIANTSAKPTFGVEREEIRDNCTYYFYGSTKDKKVTGMGEFIEKAEDMYIWILEERTDSDNEFIYKEVLSAKKIEKPELGNLGTRFEAFFFSDKTEISLNEPYKDEKRKVNLKIGKVTDSNLISEINNKGSLDKLLSYAKSSTPLYTNTIKLGNSNPITEEFDVADKEYYYVYMELDDENGKYRKIEDIFLYQGVCTKYAGNNLYSCISNQ